jgi:hypothetical protein
MLKKSFTTFLAIAISAGVFAASPMPEKELALFGNGKPPPPAPPKENANGMQTGQNCLDKNGPFVIASFLYWGSQMTEGVVTSEYTPVGSNGIAFNLSDKTIPTHYNPGFKVGIGSTMKKGTWSPMVLWTYMHSSPSKTWTSADHSLICDFALPVTQAYQSPLGGDILPGANVVHADWTLNFNSVDLEMGKTFVVSDDFAIRPFGCVKLASVFNKFQVSYIDVQSTTPFGQSLWADQFVTKENKAYLVGPRGGVNNYFRFAKDFGFLASVATSLLAVIDNPTVKANVSVPTSPLTLLPAGTPIGNKQSRRETNLQPQFDLFMGFDWGHCFKNKTYVNIAVGYEMQWYAATINAMQSLNMYGLTVDFLFDF